jgi:hypothetical protein
MVILVLKTIIVYIAILLIGTNLIGLFVRSLAFNPSTGIDMDEETKIMLDDAIANRARRANRVFSVISFVLIVAYIFALYHWWNVLLAISGVVLMLCRVPDLLFEIKTGIRFTIKGRPKGPIYTITSIALIGVIVLVYFALSQ